MAASGVGHLGAGAARRGACAARRRSCRRRRRGADRRGRPCAGPGRLGHSSSGHCAALGRERRQHEPSAGGARARSRRGRAGVPRAVPRDCQDLPLSNLERRRAQSVREPVCVARAVADAGPGCHGCGCGDGSSGRTTSRRFRAPAAIPKPRSGPFFSSSIAGSDERAREPLITYEVRADGFLRHMVRAIVGTLVEVGRGRKPAAWMSEVLESRERRRAGPTAPATGLFLVGVEYE